MSKYFSRLPNLNYPSLLRNKESSSDFVKTKNLFRRAKVREDLFANFMQFDKYQVWSDDRPDNVAEEVYNNENLDWIILMSNNIIDVKNEWPMTEGNLHTYLNDKYTPQQLTSIHHYETVEFRARNNQLIVPAGKEVDASFSVDYLEGGQIRTVTSCVKSVSVFEWEINKNDEKRNINVLKPELVGLFIKDFARIMTYDKSSQYVNKTLKKTENIRIK